MWILLKRKSIFVLKVLACLVCEMMHYRHSCIFFPGMNFLKLIFFFSGGGVCVPVFDSTVLLFCILVRPDMCLDLWWQGTL